MLWSPAQFSLIDLFGKEGFLLNAKMLFGEL